MATCSLVQTIDPKECVGNSLSKINYNFSTLETNVCSLLENTMLPIGGIIMYFGDILEFDENGRGWSDTKVQNFGLCNGNSYVDGSVLTPDLRDRFVVGAGNQYDVNNTGGLSAVSLSVGELPPHTHSITDKGHSHYFRAQQGVVDGNHYGGDSKNQAHSRTDPTENAKTGITINSTGSGIAHENRPPYCALLFIMRVE